MKKFIICFCTVLSLCAFSTQAFASQFGLYIAPKIGISLQSSSKSTVSGNFAGVRSASNLNTDTSLGLTGGIAVGYDFQYAAYVPIRTELEFMMRSTTKATNNWTSNNAPMSAKQKLSMTTFFLNAYYDFNTSSILTPYIGGGIGFASIKQKVDMLDVSGSDSKTQFAFNVGFGAAWMLGGNFMADLGYRYVYTGKSTISQTNGSDYVSSTAQPSAHELVLGLRYTF